MELSINKEELNTKLVELFTNNLLMNASQQNLDQEEISAHLILNKKKIAQDAQNVVNIVFAAYGVVDTPAEESAE